MASKGTGERIELSIHLPADVARRLQLAAEDQNRNASDVVVELLQRHLPHVQVGEKKKKGTIPYA